MHQGENHVSTFSATVGMAYWIEIRRILAHAYEGGSFQSAEVARFLAEIRLRGCLYAYRIMKKIEIVEIHGHYLLLGVVSLQLHGDNPFDRFLQSSFGNASGTPRIELFGKLLRYGAATSGIDLSHNASFHNCTG